MHGVFRIIEELIRIVNKPKKVVAKTLLYIVLVESDQFLRQECQICQENKIWDAVPRTQMADELMT